MWLTKRNDLFFVGGSRDFQSARPKQFVSTGIEAIGFFTPPRER